MAIIVPSNRYCYDYSDGNHLHESKSRKKVAGRHASAGADAGLNESFWLVFFHFFSLGFVLFLCLLCLVFLAFLFVFIEGGFLSFVLFLRFATGVSVLVLPGLLRKISMYHARTAALAD